MHQWRCQNWIIVMTLILSKYTYLRRVEYWGGNIPDVEFDIKYIETILLHLSPDIYSIRVAQYEMLLQ